MENMQSLKNKFQIGLKPIFFNLIESLYTLYGIVYFDLLD